MKSLRKLNIHLRTLALVVLAVACMPVVSCSRDAASYSFTPAGSSKPIQIPVQGVALGDPRAPVTIEEYADFQCPICKAFSDDVEPRIIDVYAASGKVRIVYHSFGNWVSRNAEGNTESERTAEAAYFAADRNRFWPMHDILFSLQGQPNSGVFSDEEILKAAAQLGLNTEKLQAALSQKIFSGRVQKDHEEGAARGVLHTPTFFINGRTIAGAQPYDTFKNAIAGALSASH